jgi:ZIP family zinc transporter
VHVIVEAFVLGALAQVSLLLAGLAATVVEVPKKVVGAMAGFGAGALVSAVSFDLVGQASSIGALRLTVWLLVGAVVFIVGDRLVERQFGEGGTGEPLGIVVGSVVDGIPESLIFGIGVASGGPVGIGFLAAVIVSNIPQALAPSVDLYHAGWSRPKLAILWGAVVLACGVAAALGAGVATAIPGVTGNELAALAAGGLLAMMTDSLMPFAYEHGGDQAGFWTVVGFALAVAPSLT